jgi:surfactin synthase thioesterase subunit
MIPTLPASLNWLPGPAMMERTRTMAADTNLSKWFVVPRRNPNASLRLFCLPYAGGNASTYTSWSKDLPADVELVAVQPPGRADRIFEPAHTSMHGLIAGLYPAMQALVGKPYVLLGHSLGSRVAFELARELRRRGHRLPAHFIASGSPAPQLPMHSKVIHELPREEFIAELRKFNGTPETVLQHDELMELSLPSLRADFKLSETYSPTDEPSLDSTLSIFSGSNDKDIDESDLIAWRMHFMRGGEITFFPEDHFFIDKLREPVLARVTDLLRRVVDDLAPFDTQRDATA